MCVMALLHLCLCVCLSICVSVLWRWCAVMTMRNMTEELLAAVNASGGNGSLVWINSHLPLPDNQDMAQHVVSIMSPDGPLPALDEVDNHVTGMHAQQICRASRGLRPYVREPFKPQTK